MNQIDTKRPYFPNLDILRFFAAALVVVGHCVKDKLIYLNLPYPFNNIFEIVCAGGNWVSLFFVLSGFLLAYLAFLDVASNEFSFKKFAARRILRIWPLYFLMLAIGYFIVPLVAQLFTGNEYSYTTLPYFLLFVGNFAMKTMYEINDFSYIPLNSSILWSISIEEQFYLILALIFTVFSGKKIIWTLALLVVGGVVYITVPKAPNTAFTYHTFYFLIDFFGGATLAAVVFFREKTMRILSNTQWLKVLILILGLLLIFLPSLFSLKIILVIWFMSIILYLTYCDDKFTRYLKRQYRLIYFGKISYGIYVIHPLFQYAFYLLINKYLVNAEQITKDLLNVFLTLVFTLSLAHGSYKYFESYFLRLKNKFY